VFPHQPVPFILEVFFDSSILVTIVVALVATWLYRRTVLRHMRGSVDGASLKPAKWRPVLAYTVVSILVIIVVTAEFIAHATISLNIPYTGLLFAPTTQLLAWILNPWTILALVVVVGGQYGYRRYRVRHSVDSLSSSPVTQRFAAQERRLRRRLALIYGIATAGIVGLAVWIEFFTGTRQFSGWLTFMMWKWFTGSEVFSLLAFTALYSAAVIPLLGVLMAWTLRRALSVLGLYLLVWLATIHTVALIFHLPMGQSIPATSTTAAMLTMPVFTFLLVLLPGPVLLLCLAGARQLRAVVPMTLVGVLLFAAMFLIAIKLLIWAYTLGYIAPALLRVAGHYGVVFLLASLPAGYLSWLGLRALVRLYDRKVCSDRQLVFDCWVLILIWYSYPRLAVRGSPELLILTGLIAFAIYRYAIQIALRLSRIKQADATNRRLLLLRVFGFQRRTEKLFDVVAQRWRFSGSVQMITSTDVATHSINPGDYIRFLSGRLAQYFLTRNSDLASYLAAQDQLRDRDGSYRINQVFCHDERWQEALIALLDCCDVVLMDLRGLSPARRGCLFELQQIVAKVPLGNVVLIVDKTTDMDLLHRTVREAVASAPAGSRLAREQDLILMRVEKLSWRGIETLFGLLWGAKPAAPAQAPGTELLQTHGDG
jgi:hypothetical protein